MRVLRTAFLLFTITLCLIAVNLMAADNPLNKQGTYVFRGDDAAILGFFYDGDTVILVSTEPDWGEGLLCSTEPGNYQWMGQLHWQEEGIVSGKYNYFIKGPVQARAYYPMTWDDVLNYPGGFCEFVKNAQPVAEGIVNFQISEKIRAPGAQDETIGTGGFRAPCSIYQLPATVSGSVSIMRSTGI